MSETTVAPVRHGPFDGRLNPETIARYAEATGDLAAHRFDIEVARAAGFDFVFTHGLCTMAICTHLLLGLVGVDDPGLVRRITVRFAAPTPLGCDLNVYVFGIDEHSFAFKATAGGAGDSGPANGTRTISHGRLELRA